MIYDFDAITEGTTLPVEAFATRNSAVQANRALYEGDFTALGVDAPTDGTYNVSLNWFRRIATFLGEFIYAADPIIIHNALSSPIQGGTSRVQSFIDANTAMVSETLLHATIDALRYGTGVVSTDPLNPLRICSFQTDNYYPVQTRDGLFQGTIIAYEVPGATAESDKRLIVAKFPNDGSEATRNTHLVKGSVVGKRVASTIIKVLPGKSQVLTLHNGYASNYQGVSAFDDVKSSVGEMARNLSALSITLQKNARPHLIGPENLLTLDDNGRAQLNPKGSFLGVADGDIVPRYLQWDSDIVATQANLDIHRGHIFDLSGLSRLLFSENARTGALTGIALKRLMLPFVAKLARLQKLNERVIEDALILLAENHAYNGGEVITIEPGSLSFAWNSDNVFLDAPQDPIRSEASTGEE